MCKSYEIYKLCSIHSSTEYYFLCVRNSHHFHSQPLSFGNILAFPPFQILKGLLMCCDESLASINTDDIIGGVKLHQLVRHFENEGRYAVEASIV